MPPRVRLYTAVGLAVWTAIAGFLLLRDYSGITNETKLLALTEARASWRKDLLYRHWAGSHGGVYVPVTETTPPNPYLAGVPERDVVTTSGKHLTLVNAAYMSRQVFEMGRERFGIRSRMTSPHPMNPANAPDPWETAALASFERGAVEVSSVESIDGRDYLRFIRPLTTEARCFRCHARQASGKQEIRGGVSVAIPMGPFYAFRKTVLVQHLLGIGLLWLVGIALMLAGGKRISGYVARIEERDKDTRESEERFRTLVENAGDAVLLHDPEGRFLDVNRRACESLGYTREELLATPVTSVESGVSPDVLHDQWSRIRPGEFITSEGVERRKDGTRFPVEVRLGAIERDGKKQILVLARDITERKRTEDALVESELRYRCLYNTTPVMLHSIDRDGRIVSVSDCWLEHLGYSREEVLGRKSVEFLTGESAKYASEVVLPEFMKTGTCKDIAYQMIRKDGTVLDVLLSATSEKDSDGRMIRSMAVIENVTERKRAEEDRKRIEDALKFVAQCGWTVSGDEFFPALARYLGSALNVDYVLVEKLLEGQDAAETVAMYARGEIVPNRRYDLRDTPCETVSGKRLCSYPRGLGELFPRGAVLAEMEAESYVGIPLWDSTGRSIGMIVVMDRKPMAHPDSIGAVLQVVATRASSEMERKRAEQEQAKLHAQLHQAMKMEAVGRLAGGVAHDFNNLLTVITGSLSMALGKLPRTGPVPGYLEDAKVAAEKAANLTRQLLAFSRKQIIEPKLLNLNRLVEEIKGMLARLIGENIELSTSLAGDLGTVKVDPGQFEQVLVNLAVNARDAMPNGGRLLVETSNADLDQAFCAGHPYITPGRYVRLVVSDTGCGMSREVKENLFVPFFTTKPKGSGTGLGLSSIYGAVKQAGGAIDVYSEEGKGTTFRIHIPRVSEEVPPPRPAASAQEPTKGTETVLLVEDEAAVRKLCLTFLDQQGYKVIEAADGEEAVALAQDRKDRIDLLLTDVVMPGISGRELAERLVRIHPETRVLFTSGYTDDSIVHYGVLEAGLSFIGKPYTLPALAKKIREVLDKSE